jgi:hypothetical protein
MCINCVVTLFVSQIAICRASRVAQWSTALLAVALEILVRVQALSQPAATRRHMRRRTIGPVLSGLGEVLANKDVLVPLCTSDSCGGLGTMHADTVARCTAFPPSQWCGWLFICCWLFIYCKYARNHFTVMFTPSVSCACDKYSMCLPQRT